MSETWGKGAKNNTISWGQGACDNTINWGKSQKDSSVSASWSGDTDISGCSGAAGLAQIDNVYSMEFDGTNDFIDLGSDILFNSTQSFTASAWIYLDSYSTTFPTVIRVKTDQSTDFIPIALSNQTNYKGVIFGSSSNFNAGRTTGDISGDFIGAWKHVCLTFNGVNRTFLSSYKIYVDGSPVTIVSAGNFGAFTSQNNLIGFSQTSNNYFNGKIDEVAIFNVALTEAEILSIYNATAVVEGVNKTGDLNQLTTPPVKWYRMGD